MDFIKEFTQDNIYINENKYSKKDIQKISTDFNYTIKPHPFENEYKVLEINKRTLINSVASSFTIFTIKDGVVIDITLYPDNINPYIAACSCKSKPDIYNTPLGKMVDYPIDKSHKISFNFESNVMVLVFIM